MKGRLGAKGSRINSFSKVFKKSQVYLFSENGKTFSSVYQENFFSNLQVTKSKNTKSFDA